jgi:hypothetical protein
VQRAYSFFASNEVVVHFGIGQATRVLDISVTWSRGRTESFGIRSAGMCHRIVEGKG